MQPSRGEKPGLVEKEGPQEWGGESRTQGGFLSEQPPPAQFSPAWEEVGRRSPPGDPLYCQLSAAEIAPF